MNRDERVTAEASPDLQAKAGPSPNRCRTVTRTIPGSGWRAISSELRVGGRVFYLYGLFHALLEAVLLFHRKGSGREVTCNPEREYYYLGGFDWA